MDSYDLYQAPKFQMLDLLLESIICESTGVDASRDDYGDPTNLDW